MKRTLKSSYLKEITFRCVHRNVDILEVTTDPSLRNSYQTIDVILKKFIKKIASI